MDTNRREFLGGVGKSAALAAVGWALASRAGFAELALPFARERLRFGLLDPLVDLLQATPPDELMALVVQKLRAGTPLADVVGAAALANARAFGGTNYDGYHTLMAMVPSYEMAAQMPAPLAPLPVLKVLHRNARTIQVANRADQDALEPLESSSQEVDLAARMRERDVAGSEQRLAALEGRSREQAYEELQALVREDINVHRVVLAWRSRDLLRLTGAEQEVTLMRQPVRFCINEDSGNAQRGRGKDPIATLVPQLMEQHGLEGRELGKRAATEAELEQLAGVFFGGERADAAKASAEALASGLDPDDVARALSIAGARLLLNDPGYAQASPGKPIGSVHGASTGVHASDAANAWRHLARTGTNRNAFADLIASAYHTAGQSQHVGKEPNDHDAEPCTKKEPAELFAELDTRIRARDQKGACAAARQYCALGHDPSAWFSKLLPFAVSEDGALHAEKYFRTAQEEYAFARPAHRTLHLVALTRVMASHYGNPAPGVEDARKLLTA